MSSRPPRPVTPRFSESRHIAPLAGGTTDADGGFAFTVAADAKTGLLERLCGLDAEVIADGWIRARADIKNGTDGHIVLRRGGDVTVSVVREDGSPGCECDPRLAQGTPADGTVGNLHRRSSAQDFLTETAANGRGACNTRTRPVVRAGALRWAPSREQSGPRRRRLENASGARRARRRHRPRGPRRRCRRQVGGRESEFSPAVDSSHLERRRTDGGGRCRISGTRAGVRGALRRDHRRRPFAPAVLPGRGPEWRGTGGIDRNPAGTCRDPAGSDTPPLGGGARSRRERSRCRHRRREGVSGAQPRLRESHRAAGCDCHVRRRWRLRAAPARGGSVFAHGRGGDAR